MTLEQLAEKANVTKGLISQIENNRTVPSLPVLFSLIHALDESVKDFFEDLHEYHINEHVLIVRGSEAVAFKKEPVRGFTYNRILTKSLLSQTIDVVLLELRPGAARKEFIQTDAFECKHVLQGQINYEVEKQSFDLRSGDTLFFDGRARHRLKNTGSSTAKILVIYFFA